jgi:hypothetical protein
MRIMSNWEYLDEHVQDRHEFGDHCSSRCLRAWAEEAGYVLNPNSVLTAHRQHPEERVFGLERVGMGPGAYYVVVETGEQVEVGAVKRMHQQQGKEAIKRFLNEYRWRMSPIASRNPAAKRAFNKAHKQLELVAASLDFDLAELEEELADR